MKEDARWLVAALEISGWLVLVFAVFASIVASPTMLGLIPTWLSLVALARVLSRQHLYAERQRREVAAMVQRALEGTRQGAAE